MCVCVYDARMPHHTSQQQELEWLPIISHMVADSLATESHSHRRPSNEGGEGAGSFIIPQPRLLQK